MTKEQVKNEIVRVVEQKNPYDRVEALAANETIGGTEWYAIARHVNGGETIYKFWELGNAVEFVTSFIDLKDV